jgi:hypothetical protein
LEYIQRPVLLHETRTIKKKIYIKSRLANENLWL